MIATEDIKLIRQIKSGDKQAFDALVRRHYQNIFSYCYRRVVDKDVAADLTQDIFLKLVASIYRYSISGKFNNYLFTIAVNTCNDYLRKGSLSVADEKIEQIEDNKKQPVEIIIENEQNELLQKKLASLPDIQREALILYYYHGLKAKDIAAVTGVSVPTAKSRIKQGKDKLKKIYQKEGVDYE